MTRSIDRIVVIHDYSEPEGGAGILSLAAIRSYRQRGYPVTLVSGQGRTSELDALGVDVVGLGSEGLLAVSALKALRQGYHNADAQQVMADWIDRNDTPGTVYHLHNWSQILSPSIFIPLRRVAERVIVTCHDFFNTCPNGGFVHYGRSEVCEKKPLSAGCLASQCDRRSALHKYWRVARTQHLNRIAGFGKAGFAFTFIHEKMLDRFVAAGFQGRDLHAIRNPAEAWTSDRINAASNRGYLYVGRVSSEKGIDVALEATCRADVPLTVVGQGEKLEELKSAYPHADFVGWKKRAEIAEYARSARALLMPSRWPEPFGLVAFEAALSGLPVIVSRTAYVAEDFERLGAGIQIDPTDTDSLSALLTGLSTDNARVDAMSLAGFERAQEACNTLESWIDALMELFQRRLDGGFIAEAAQ